MAPALFTTGQSRWALHLLVSLLSAVAIASSAPSGVGGADMYSGYPGDIRGLTVILGSTGLGGILVLRTASLILSRPWRIYVDRLEFTFVSMLWICWTSATMAFSAFTLDKGVCSAGVSVILLPACPLLTLDLTILHLISISTFALLLVILSTALSPSYYLSHSTLINPDSDSVTEVTASSALMQGKGSGDPDNDNVFVMWDLALASPPSSPRLKPTNPTTGRSYGTTTSTTPLTSSSFPPMYNPYLPVSTQNSPEEPFVPPKKRDKFAEGRLFSYLSLVGCSLGVVGGTALIIGQGEFVLSSVLIIMVGVLSLSFAFAFLVLHFQQANLETSPAKQGGFMRRHGRAMEVGMAGGLFLLWPLAAIIYTLFPSSPNRPCSHPQSQSAPYTSPPSTPEDDPSTPLSSLCILSSTVIALAWLASWIILARVLGLIFPMPDVGRLKVAVTNDVGEGRSLLGSTGGERLNVRGDRLSSGNVAAVRPQVGYGRIVAGEAFELGDDDEE